MIGKIVERIIEAGFDIWIHPTSAGVLFIHITKRVGEGFCRQEWALSQTELMQAHEVVLLEECEQKLQQLQQAVEQKTATPAREDNHAQ